MKQVFKIRNIVILLFMFSIGITAGTFYMAGKGITDLPVIGKAIGEYFASSKSGNLGESSQSPKIIVIDPGHGGIDGGASGKSGVLERDINLSIAQCLAEEIGKYPIEVKLTREDQAGLYVDDSGTIRQKKREDLLKRKEIMEGENVALAVSIHLNSFSGDERIYGAQVFYPKQQKKGTDVQSQKSFSQIVAESVQESLNTNIPNAKKRTAMAKGDILIFQNTCANIILVECGFLSNEREENLLKTPEYQRLLSDAIWKGINEILCLEETEKIKIIDSANKNLLPSNNHIKICG